MTPAKCGYCGVEGHRAHCAGCGRSVGGTDNMRALHLHAGHPFCTECVPSPATTTFRIDPKTGERTDT